MILSTPMRTSEPAPPLAVPKRGDVLTLTLNGLALLRSACETSTTETVEEYDEPTTLPVS
jgi:hypothetical protein